MWSGRTGDVENLNALTQAIAGIGLKIWPPWDYCSVRKSHKRDSLARLPLPAAARPRHRQG
jgi:hypothetical protein